MAFAVVCALVHVGILAVLKLEKNSPPSSSQMMPFRFLLTSVTVTAQVAFFVLSPFAVAVTVALPAAIAVTTPFSSTVATEGLEEDHETVRSLAVSGRTFAPSDAVSPL